MHFFTREAFSATGSADLLSENDWRLGNPDKSDPFWPEVSRVCFAFALAGITERLAGTASGPDGAVVWPSCITEGKTPEPAAGKEVALGISHKVVWFDIGNASLIYISWCNRTRLDCLANRLRFQRIDFVVVGTHAVSFLTSVVGMKPGSATSSNR
jgi:hypothetical protein